jgi:hypothetical protein
MNDADNYRVNPGLKLLPGDAGISADKVLRRAALPHELFARENAWLTPKEFFRLWRALEDDAYDPLLPIRIGQSISAETFDPLALSALCSRDLNSAAHRVATYKWLVGQMRLIATTTETQTTLELRGPEPIVPPPSLAAVDFVVAIARIATRSRVRPVSISSLALPENAQGYLDYLGVAITKGSSYSVVSSAPDAGRPFLTVNEAMWQSFEPRLRRRLAELQPGAPGNCRRALGACSVS